MEWTKLFLINIYYLSEYINFTGEYNINNTEQLEELVVVNSLYDIDSGNQC